EEFFVSYRCRVGLEDYMTPIGTYHIARRSMDPTWTDPQTGRRIPAGDPANELGTRWMGFEEIPSIGIHGTIHPETIGADASSGCIGLLTEDVEQLYDLLPQGTEVRIYQNRAEAERSGDRQRRASLPRSASGESDD
ncbi:L,D-transpeptidase, partial [Candidatus Sumerlaeota bacterium]|nr:L,D-transpeptidase [Candidatus Sumerlaeota bacterium]